MKTCLWFSKRQRGITVKLRRWFLKSHISKIWTQLLSTAFNQPIWGSVGALLSSDLFRLTGPGLTMQLCCWNRLTHQVTGGVGVHCSLFLSCFPFSNIIPRDAAATHLEQQWVRWPDVFICVVSVINFTALCLRPSLYLPVVALWTSLQM